MPRVPVAPLLPPEEANRFGFDWPSVTHPSLPAEMRADGAHIQVTRTTQIQRGKKGTWRVLTVKTEREELHVYVTPTGKMRVFKAGEELLAPVLDAKARERIVKARPKRR